MTRERLAGFVVLFAGVYIFFAPLTESPWSCLRAFPTSLDRAYSNCSALPPFDLAVAVSVLLVVFGIWILTSAGRATTRVEALVLVGIAAVLIVPLLIGFAASPFGPLAPSRPQPTAQPVQSVAPTR